jgi:predicted deacylase
MKVILNILTHGDECIGLGVAKEIEKLGIDPSVLTIQVANERAYKAGKRYIDADLNRSFPGKASGNYEQRLAWRLSKKIREADIVIDVHSTRSELKDALIVGKLDHVTKRYLKIIQPKYVLLMTATKDCALICQAKVGIAFEYGKDRDPATLKKIVLDIKRLLGHLGIIKERFTSKKIKTMYFDVFGSEKKPAGYKLLSHVKNYKLVKRGQPFAKKGTQLVSAKEDFYPILFGNTNYEVIFGFRARKI